MALRWLVDMSTPECQHLSYRPNLPINVKKVLKYNEERKMIKEVLYSLRWWLVLGAVLGFSVAWWADSTTRSFKPSERTYEDQQSMIQIVESINGR